MTDVPPYTPGFAHLPARDRQEILRLGRRRAMPFWRRLAVLVICWPIPAAGANLFIYGTRPIGLHTVGSGIAGLSGGLLGAGLAAALWIKTVGKRIAREVVLEMRRRGLCLACGYNLTGNISGTCPECGQNVESSEDEAIAANKSDALGPPK